MNPNLSSDRFFVGLFSIVALIVPGTFFLYITNRGLFNTLEPLSLLMLVVAYTTPIYVMGIICGIVGDQYRKARGKALGHLMIYSAVGFTLVTFFASVLIWFYAGYSLLYTMYVLPAGLMGLRVLGLLFNLWLGKDHEHIKITDLKVF